MVKFKINPYPTIFYPDMNMNFYVKNNQARMNKTSSGQRPLKMNK